MKRLILITMLVLFSSSIALAQDFCKGDFNYNGSVGAEDVTEFLNHFGRHPFNEPCPPDGPATVPKTGQTISYATGDDGDHQRGVALVSPRFTDNRDGTVTDNQTGLIWLQDANCFGLRTWEQALTDSNGLASGSCGLSDGSQAEDWRLPNYKELFSLVDASNYEPALSSGHPFDNVQFEFYWSSTTNANWTVHAWLVFMGSGHVYDYHKTNAFYIWPVRGGH